MKYISFIIILVAQFNVAAGQKSNYTAAEIKRLADFGRIWGMINYFHPTMGAGNIATEGLVVPGANALAADPSETNFKTAVATMLLQLNDPATNIAMPATADSAMLYNAGAAAAVHRLSSGYWFLAMPTVAFANNDTNKIPGILPEYWDSAKGIIADLRNKRKLDDYMDYGFINDVLPLIEKKIAGGTLLPEVFERVVYHNGMVPQENGENNVYYSGWKTITKSTRPVTAVTGNTGVQWNKPVAFIINNNTGAELIKRLLVLRAAARCLIVYEGPMASYPTGSVTQFTVADGQTFNLRTSDWVFGSKGGTPLPDLLMPAINSFDEHGDFIRQLTALLDKGSHPQDTNDKNLSLQYHLPRFTDTNTGFIVNTGQRLFALYNFWNAIRYFYPYKKLLSEDWNTVLEDNVVKFIGAKDSVSYNYALRGLISRIHDCHGFFYSPKGVTPVRYELGSWPAVDLKFIGNQLFIDSIGKDSLVGKNIKQWDEVIEIGGISVAQCLDKWRWYTSTSNEATYKRDIAGIFLGGKLNTRVTLKIRRGNMVFNETLNRSGRYIPTDRPLDFNKKYPTFKLLDSTIGYVNMGALKQNAVDSLFQLFKNTRAIILDIRNYPNGTAWAIAPRLTTVKKQAVKFHYPLITAENINGGEDDITGESFFVVNPDTTKPVYKGKIIMLCNVTTQSQAEYTIMMLQGATQTTVIGSQTAGADGNVTTVVLPGNYRASFSGLEILYPDGTQTQRSGIKIDIPCSYTLKGIMEGRDEVMERAIRYIKTGR